MTCVAPPGVLKQRSRVRPISPHQGVHPRKPSSVPWISKLSRPPGQIGERATARVRPRRSPAGAAASELPVSGEPDRRRFCRGTDGQLKGGGVAGGISPPFRAGCTSRVRASVTPIPRRQYASDRTRSQESRSLWSRSLRRRTSARSAKERRIVSTFTRRVMPLMRMETSPSSEGWALSRLGGAIQPVCSVTNWRT